MNSLRPFTAFFIYPVAGYLADRYGRVKIIAVTDYVSAALYLVFMLAPDWRILAFGNFLMGVTAFFFPAMNALMADSLPPQRRGIGYSLWRVFPSAVGILSPYIGGYLITILGVEQAMRFLYGLAFVTAVVIATMNLKFLRETIKGKDDGSSGKGLIRILSHSYRDMFEVLRQLPRNLKAFTLMLAISVFFNNLTAPYWVVCGVNKIGLSELQWGTILLVAAVVNVVLLVLAGVIIDRLGVKRVLVFAMTLSAAPIFCFPSVEASQTRFCSSSPLPSLTPSSSPEPQRSWPTPCPARRGEGLLLC